LAAVEGAGDRTQDLIVALGHPTRRQILREMDGNSPISPRQVSERLDETLSNVSYHFRVLAEAGALELVSTRPVRGSTQHFYESAIGARWALELLALDEGSRPGAEGRELQAAAGRRGEEIT
jgi:DNA-binding transcriptional ArsR family regulator